MRSVRELMSLDGRTALIMGGAGYLGTAMAAALAELGATVVLADLSEERLSAAAAQLRDGASILTHAVDVTDDEAVAGIPAFLQREVGRLDVLVNAAALVGTSALPGWTTPFEQQRVDVWRRALDVNLTAAFHVTQQCVPMLRASGSGSIINIGSTYGLVGPDWRLYEGTPLGNPAAYAASKGGLLQLTTWLATTLAPAIRVNAITPGGIFRNQPEPFLSRYTSRVPLGRMATEEDFKGAVAYLASDLSAYVTGHNVVVDGGWTAW